MTVDIKLKPLNVAIVGGGSGGLETAITLSETPNVEVTIYEQANVLQGVGVRISIGPNSCKTFELLSAADAMNNEHPTRTTLNLLDGVFFDCCSLKYSLHESAMADQAKSCAP